MEQLKTTVDYDESALSACAVISFQTSGYQSLFAADRWGEGSPERSRPSLKKPLRLLMMMLCTPKMNKTMVVSSADRSVGEG